MYECLFLTGSCRLRIRPDRARDRPCRTFHGAQAVLTPEPSSRTVQTAVARVPAREPLG